MNISCGIAKDLLPLYADGLLGQESISAVEEHLKACESCQSLLSSMKEPVSTAPPGSLPIKSLQKKLRRSKLRIGALAAALVLFFATLVLYHSTARHYIKYIPSVITATREASGKMLLEYSISAEADIKGYEVEEPSNLTGGKATRQFVYYVTLYNHDKQSTGSSLYRLDLHKGKDFKVYYAYPNEKVVPLYGRDKGESFVVLPRLALNYYMFLAAVFTIIYAALTLLLRKRLKARRVFMSLGALSLAYVIAHMGIKGLDGTSWNILRDLSFILAAWVFAGSALLITLSRRHHEGF